MTTLENRAEMIKRKWSEFIDCVQMHGTGMSIQINDRSFAEASMERTIPIKDADLLIRVTL